MNGFLLTRPSRGATYKLWQIRNDKLFLLTRPSRGATAATLDIDASNVISTHTPLAGRDFFGLKLRLAP